MSKPDKNNTIILEPQPGVDTWDAQWLAKEKRKLRLKEQVTKNKETVRDASEFIASLAPGVGELLDLKLIYNDAKLGNYGSMAAGMAFFVLPEALEQAIKGGIKVAKKFIPKTKSAKLAEELNKAVSETKLPETKSTKAKTVEHKPTSTLQENLLTLLNAQDINRINSIKSNISEAERMGIPKGERNLRVPTKYSRVIPKKSYSGISRDIKSTEGIDILLFPYIDINIDRNERYFNATQDRIKKAQKQESLDDYFNEFFETTSPNTGSLVLKIQEQTKTLENLLTDYSSSLPPANPKFMTLDGSQSIYVLDYRRYLARKGYSLENISDEQLGRIISQQYQDLTNSMVGKTKGLVLWHGTPSDFDVFDYTNTGKFLHNSGSAGPGNYFSIGRTPYAYAPHTVSTWNIQPYLINDIKSTPPISVLRNKGLEKPMILNFDRYPLDFRQSMFTSKPDWLIIDDYTIPLNGTMIPEINGSLYPNSLEFSLRRNTGIKSLFPHPDTFVRNPDGSVSILRDWNDPRVNYKNGGKIKKN